MHCPSTSFGSPVFLGGITMLPLSLIILEIV
jgi:hypothetical protein